MLDFEVIPIAHVYFSLSSSLLSLFFFYQKNLKALIIKYYTGYYRVLGRNGMLRTGEKLVILNTALLIDLILINKYIYVPPKRALNIARIGKNKSRGTLLTY